MSIKHLIVRLIVVYPFGFVGSVLSIVYTAVGIPMQMLCVWQAKDVSAISAFPYWIGIAIAFHIGVQQYQLGSMGLMCAMIANFLATSLILCQIYYYR